VDQEEDIHQLTEECQEEVELQVKEMMVVVVRVLPLHGVEGVVVALVLLEPVLTEEMVFKATSQGQ
jgi:hypothetical protein